MPKALSVPVASAVRRVPLHPRADPRRPGTIHRGTHRQPKAAVHAFPEFRKIYFLSEHANLSRREPPLAFRYEALLKESRPDGFQCRG